MGGYERADIISRTEQYQSASGGEGAIPHSGQGIYDESLTAKYDVGRRMALGDGRVFYYCKNGAVALTVGRLIQSTVNRTDLDDISTTAAGDTHVDLVTAAATYTKNQFANGYAVITDIGYVYKIRGHDAINSGGVGRIDLYDPIVIAHTAQDVTLHENPCHGVVVTPDLVGFTIGVPLIAVTASYYFWAQTWGPAAVECRSVGTGDKWRALGNDASGVSLMAVIETAVTGCQIVAYNMFDGVGCRADEYEMVYLQCMA